MATTKQKEAARGNIKKAAVAAKSKQTLKHLPKETRRAMGKQGGQGGQGEEQSVSRVRRFIETPGPAGADCVAVLPVASALL